MLKNFLLLITFIFIPLFAQNEPRIEQIEEAFRSNDYSRAIELAGLYLSANNNISENTALRLHEIRAVSFYSIAERDSAKNSFFEILEIDQNYSPNPSNISPKIIRFFNEIKNDFDRVMSLRNERIDSLLTLSNPIENKNFGKDYLIANMTLRSLILPGWGHLYAGKTGLGIGLSAVSGALIGTSIYYIINTENLKDEYVSESDRNLIREKYDDYNSSFKIRNALLISYAAVWIFSQLDILFFSRDDLINLNSESLDSFSNNFIDLKITLNFPLN